MSSRPSVLGAICSATKTIFVRGNEVVERSGSIASDLLAAGQIHSSAFLFNTACDVAEQQAERQATLTPEQKQTALGLLAAVGKTV